MMMKLWPSPPLHSGLLLIPPLVQFHPYLSPPLCASPLYPNSASAAGRSAPFNSLLIPAPAVNTVLRRVSSAADINAACTSSLERVCECECMCVLGQNLLVMEFFHFADQKPDSVGPLSQIITRGTLTH